MHTRLRAIAVLSLVLAAGPALGQSRLGAFARFNSWWIHPVQGTLGIAFDSQAIRIDRDGDGSTESTFLRPTGATGIPDNAITSLRLTPSRTIVYAFGGTCSGTGTLVYFYRIPDFGNRLEPIRTGLCIPHGIDQEGFYDTGLCAEPNGPGLGLDCIGHLGVSPQRIAFFATASSSFGFENLVWVDLVTGSSSTVSAFDFAKNLGFVHVSPSGTQAFVQHDLGLPGETDYRLIDLCPGSLGTVINVGGFPIVDVSGGVLGAEVTAVSGGNVTIEVGPAGGPVRTTFDLSDCLVANGACCYESGCAQFTSEQCAPFGTFLGAGSSCDACPAPPVLEACCFESGEPICSRLANAACTEQGGTPQPGVSYCAFDTCPTVQLELAISGPTQAGVGDTITYTLEYHNAGVMAPSVEIEIAPPYGTTFVSATGGGDFDVNVVRWVLGNLAPGASGSVSFTVQVDCLAAGNFAYVSGLISYSPPPDGGRSYFPSNNLEVDFASAASGPLAVSLASTPDGEPLLPGDEVEHAITLTNANPEAITSVQIGRADSFTPAALYYGEVASFSRAIDAAGGTFDTSGSGLLWTGDVPAGASRTIRFATKIDACVPAANDMTTFDFGIAVAAFDQCDTKLGESGVPESFALGHRVDVSIAATNLAPAQRLRAPIVDANVQVARPGAAVDVAVTIAAGAGQAVPNVSLSADVDGIAVTAPPTEPGASYNATSHELSWTGTVPATGSTTIHLSGTLTACRGELDLDGSTGPGCTDVRAQALLAAVPVPPNGPWLAALAQRDVPGHLGVEEDLLWVDPGPPVRTTTMLCLPSEFASGIGAAPNGDIWVGWLPTYRVNPRTLAFQAFDYDRIYDVGLSNLVDIAIDPDDGTVYMSGNRYDQSGNAAAVVRYHPASDTLEPFYESSSYQSIGSLVVDGQGSVAALAYVGAQNALVRIDPSDPSTADVLYDPPSTSLTDVALDRDDSYVVIDGSYGATPTVYDVDRDTGDRTTLVADLRVPFPTVLLWGQVEVDAQGDLFVSPQSPGLGHIDLATPAVGTALLPITPGGIGGVTDMALVSAAPEPGASGLALVALGALALLRRASRARDLRASR